jgi:hypothetical protein
MTENQDKDEIIIEEKDDRIFFSVPLGESYKELAEQRKKIARKKPSLWIRFKDWVVNDYMFNHKPKSTKTNPYCQAMDKRRHNAMKPSLKERWLVWSLGYKDVEEMREDAKRYIIKRDDEND